MTYSDRQFMSEVGIEPCLLELPPLRFFLESHRYIVSSARKTVPHDHREGSLGRVSAVGHA